VLDLAELAEGISEVTETPAVESSHGYPIQRQRNAGYATGVATEADSRVARRLAQNERSEQIPVDSGGRIGENTRRSEVIVNMAEAPESTPKNSLRP
jgi:hypothetical protein